MTPTGDLRVGDVIEVWWSPGYDMITDLTPYRGPLLWLLGEGTMLAEFFHNRTGMTLPAGETHRVVPPGKLERRAAR